MEHHGKVAAVLLLVCVMAASASVLINSGDTPRTCRRARRNCERTHLESLDLPEEAELPEILSNRTLLGLMSQALQDNKRCVDGLITSGVCTKKDVNEEVVLLDFITTWNALPESIDLLVNVSGSGCLVEDSLEQEELGMAYYMCLIAASSSNIHEQPCQSISQLWSCIKSAIRNVCGEALGTLVQSVIDHLWGSPEGQALFNYYRQHVEIDVDSCDFPNTLAKRYIKAKNAKQPALEVMRRSIFP